MLDTIPQPYRKKIKLWMPPAFEVLHFWEVEGTYFVVCQSQEILYFLRLFMIAEEVELSQDGAQRIIIPGVRS